MKSFIGKEVFVVEMNTCREFLHGRTCRYSEVRIRALLCKIASSSV